MKRRIKKGPIIIVILVLLVIGIGGVAIYKNIEYKNSNTYKLLQLGYKENEVKTIENKLKNVNKIVESKYNAKIPKILEQKYFLEKNLDRYVTYSNEKVKEDLNNVVALVNVDADMEDYGGISDVVDDKETVIELENNENIKITDKSKKEAILVNKHIRLDKEYAPEKIVNISTKYAYANNQISSEIYDIFKEMCDDAKQDNITLVATSGYRSYADQEKVYLNYIKKGGQKYADEYAARPGFSEHQTGLTLDIMGYGLSKEAFETSDAFKWLTEHAHEYGFILRYPKGKENITGYAYEAWHYRYVGKDLAKKIRDEGITFDEYYAYYLDK